LDTYIFWSGLIQELIVFSISKKISAKIREKIFKLRWSRAVARTNRRAMRWPEGGSLIRSWFFVLLFDQATER